MDTVESFPEKTIITGISSANAATHESTDLISALKHTDPDAPLSPLGTEKIDALRNTAEISQGQMTGKPNLRQLKLRPKY